VCRRIVRDNIWKLFEQLPRAAAGRLRTFLRIMVAGWLAHVRCILWAGCGGAASSSVLRVE
jgi:hypothetical protein